MPGTADRQPFFRYLRKCLQRKGRTREDAEDLVQEAFLRLELYCSKGNEVKEPRAFLMRAALNLAVSHHRRERISPVSSGAIESLEIVDWSCAPDVAALAGERLERVARALNAASQRAQNAFLLHRVGGFSYAEIAQKLGVSISSIEKDIAAAAAALALERQSNGI